MRKGIIIILIFLTCLANSCVLLLTTVPSKIKTLNFPADHLPHTGVMSEWWYFNGHLLSADNRKYSYGIALFRASPGLYFVHLSFTDHQSDQFYFDRLFYPVITITSDRKKQFLSYGKDQLIRFNMDGRIHLSCKWKNIEINLQFQSEKLPMLVNENAWIDMPEGKGSAYYSLTRLKSHGNIIVKGKKYPVNGISWMDHQWGNYIVKDKGWDWFSIQLDDSTEYNLYSFRNARGKVLKQYVNVLEKDNKLSMSGNFQINRLETWKNPITGRHYTTAWQLIVPARKDTFYLAALKQNQEIFSTRDRDILPSYWEGACSVEKHTADGRTVFGKAFSEHFPVSKTN